jgi:hypothetical protein
MMLVGFEVAELVRRNSKQQVRLILEFSFPFSFMVYWRNDQVKELDEGLVEKVQKN